MRDTHTRDIGDTTAMPVSLRGPATVLRGTMGTSNAEPSELTYTHSTLFFKAFVLVAALTGDTYYYLLDTQARRDRDEGWDIT